MKTAALMLDNNRCLSVKVAQNIFEKAHGLAGEEEWTGIPLVFLFRRKCRPAFWMHRVNFSLDMIWISQGKIIGITRNVPPANRGLLHNLFFLKRYYPPQKIDMVIEMAGGESKQFGLVRGQTVRLEG